MPITKAVTAGLICQPPDAGAIVREGYLHGTEWTCEHDGAVYMLDTRSNSLQPRWVFLYRQKETT